jgi:hypothetical protein
MQSLLRGLVCGVQGLRGTCGVAAANWLTQAARCHLCRKLPEKIGDALTPQQYQDIEELGILADKDDQVLCLLCT